MALVDCFTELITYTGYLLRDVKERPVSYEEASKNCHSLVFRAEACGKSSGFSEAEWREAFFPVCAWMDETILCSEWSEKGKWEHAQLQREYFHTTQAGSEFFTRLENLGENAGAVREVYVFCLALGFRGSYYQASDDGKLEEIRLDHLAKMTERASLVFPQELFPDAYEAILAARKRKGKKWRRISFFSISVMTLPILLFAGLFFLFDSMLTNEVTRYLGLDRSPLQRGAYFKGKIPIIAEHLGLKLAQEKAGDTKAAEEVKAKAHEKVSAEKKTPPGKVHGHYVVKKEDTLSSIAGREDVYGNPLKWPVLYRYNSKELGEMKEGVDFPDRALHAGMKLKTVSHGDVQENLKKRSSSPWVVNVQSSAVYGKIIHATIELTKLGYSPYITKARTQGQEWIRLRVGFFKTQAETEEEAKKIRAALRLDKTWTTKISNDEFDQNAGY